MPGFSLVPGFWLIVCGIANAEALLLPRLHAQRLNPNVPNPNRSVHPGIADSSSALAPVLYQFSSPLFAVPDNEWNHCEGFAPNNHLDNDYGVVTSPPVPSIR